MYKGSEIIFLFIFFLLQIALHVNIKEAKYLRLDKYNTTKSRLAHALTTTAKYTTAYYSILQYTAVIQPESMAGQILN